MRRLIASIYFLSILVVSTCTPAFAADFYPVFKETILPHEGGYTAARNDPGNWTGGKVGVGKLLGTKYGIAANTYGVELLRQGRTIKGLTVDDSAFFYKRDFWDANHFGELKSQGIADELMDEAVNMGSGGARRLLSKVLAEIAWTGRTVPPAEFTPATIAWINEYTKDRDNRVAFWNSIRIKRVTFYVNLVKRKPSMRPYFLSWIERTVD